MSAPPNLLACVTSTCNHLATTCLYLGDCTITAKLHWVHEGHGHVLSYTQDLSPAVATLDDGTISMTFGTHLMVADIAPIPCQGRLLMSSCPAPSQTLELRYYSSGKSFFSSGEMGPRCFKLVTNCLSLLTVACLMGMGALAEVHFTLCHWPIASLKHDVYGGQIQLIHMLSPPPTSSSSKKRKIPLHLDVNETPLKKTTCV
ncbi:hypothetical protein EDC04DRAFT_2601295 [Pisolithus marmoratus]|nr:hypothetical protein EDC04DRAFT_2601295 [Pisolithus marmoratus]